MARGSLNAVRRLGSGIVGCGNIAGPYAKTLITSPELKLLGVTEVGQDTVRLRGEKGALRGYCDGGVASPRVETVKEVDLAEGPADVNLVIFARNRPAPNATVRLRIDPAYEV